MRRLAIGLRTFGERGVRDAGACLLCGAAGTLCHWLLECGWLAQRFHLACRTGFTNWLSSLALISCWDLKCQDRYCKPHPMRNRSAGVSWIHNVRFSRMGRANTLSTA
eukprot:4345918-Amphidinium_carterae.1